VRGLRILTRLSQGSYDHRSGLSKPSFADRGTAGLMRSRAFRGAAAVWFGRTARVDSRDDH